MGEVQVRVDLLGTEAGRHAASRAVEDARARGEAPERVAELMRYYLELVGPDRWRFNVEPTPYHDCYRVEVHGGRCRLAVMLVHLDRCAPGAVEALAWAAEGEAVAMRYTDTLAMLKSGTGRQ